MKRHHFIIGTAVAALLIGTVGHATDTRTLQVHCKGSGTFADGVETHIDTNGDGASAAGKTGRSKPASGGSLVRSNMGNERSIPVTEP